MSFYRKYSKGGLVLAETKEYSKFLETVTTIYRDILNYQNILEVRGFVPLDKQVDLNEAKVLIDFIQSGSYLDNGRLNKNLKKMVRIYSLQTKPEDLAVTFNLSIITIYKYANAIEQALQLVFPKGLLELWRSKNYEEINNCIMRFNDTSFADDVVLGGLDTLTKYSKGMKCKKKFVVEKLQQLRLGVIDEELAYDLETIQKLSSYLSKLENSVSCIATLKALNMCKEKSFNVSQDVLDLL